MSSGRGNENYLIFSDVHLGADLVQHARPWTVARLKQVARIDRDLSSMLDFYREARDPERPWRLVIAGDLVDFIGMSIAPRPDEPLDSTMTDEERSYGLGSSRDHAAYKLRAVIARHSLVFEKLASFVADGHSLVLVRGNHDIDFHWGNAREVFLEALIERVPGLATDAEQRALFEARIEFVPWFYYVENLLYVEHGHQYDATCSYANLLAPVSAHDPQRISESMSDILLRCICRPTPGVGSEGHEHRGFMSYVKLGLSMGFGGAFRLLYRYLYASVRAIRSWRSLVDDRAQALKLEHEARMEELEVRGRVGIEKLRALAALAVPPITRELGAILRSLFLDRVALGLVLVATLSVLPFIGLDLAYWTSITAGLFVITGLVFVWQSQPRVIDPSQSMHLSAKRIAELLPTRFVVMGHTHEPVMTPVGSQATYVNVGAWAVDDLDGPGREPLRTHLVIRFIDGKHRAELCRWDPEKRLLSTVANALD